MGRNLTPVQQQKILEYRNMSIDVGNCTKTIDKVENEKSLRKLYSYCGLRQPKKVHYVSSPKSAQDFIKKITNEYAPVTSFCTGSQEAYWIFYYMFYNKELGMSYDRKATEGLEIMTELCYNSGWFYLFDEFAVVCDKPEIITLDENNDPHNESGPCIKYRDGVELYAIHGHSVPKNIIMQKNKITIDMIKNETNTETKRIMTEFYGISKYLNDTGAEYIDIDVINIKGSAPRALILDNSGLKWLISTDGSTKRVYEMAVPDYVMTCKEAHEEICGFDESRIISEA